MFIATGGYMNLTYIFLLRPSTSSIYDVVGIPVCGLLFAFQGQFVSFPFPLLSSAGSSRLDTSCPHYFVLVLFVTAVGLT